MKAIAINDFAINATVHHLPEPTPGPGEVLVRVEASSVNGIDVHVASGMLKGMIEYKLPIVLGRDYAGTVEAVGSGVTGLGERESGSQGLQRGQARQGRHHGPMSTPISKTATARSV